MLPKDLLVRNRGAFHAVERACMQRSALKYKMVLDFREILLHTVPGPTQRVVRTLVGGVRRSAGCYNAAGTQVGLFRVSVSESAFG